MRYIEDDLEGKRILITGGAGFIGSNLAAYFQENHPQSSVVIFDCFRNKGNAVEKTLGHYKNLLWFKGEVITGNTNNSKDIQRLADDQFDYIFHHATLSDTTCNDQELMLRANTNAFKDILEIAKMHKAKLVYASSAGIYGKTAPPNIVGKNEIPETVYGFSKLIMDNIAKKYVQDNPMHVVGLRYFNVYGRREFYKGEMASMILQLGLQALKDKRVRLFRSGEQKRDFVYIEDVVQANVKALSARQNGVYNVGSGIARSFNDIIGILKNEFGDFETEYIDNPYTFYQEHTEADISCTQRYLGYQPNYSLEKGIKCYAKGIHELYISNA